MLRRAVRTKLMGRWRSSAPSTRPVASSAGNGNNANRRNNPIPAHVSQYRGASSRNRIGPPKVCGQALWVQENTPFGRDICDPMLRMHRPRKLAAPLGAVVLLVAAAVFGPAWWRTYLEALARRSAPLYQPRERVIGGNEPLAPRVAPASEQLDAAALEEAARYAGAHGSRALIVTRHDHIVFERYWQGTDFDTLSDAQSFTPVLAALATGAALSHRRLGWPDEPIGLLISEWREDPRGAITLRNLMQMSSGLAPQSPARRRRISPPRCWRARWPGRPAWRASSSGPTRSCSRSPSSARRSSATQPICPARCGGASGPRTRWLWLDHQGGTAHADCCMFARQGDWIRLAQMMLQRRQLPRR